MSKIAIVVLSQTSSAESLSTDELEGRIQQELKLGSLSRSWKVEKVTVLEG